MAKIDITADIAGMNTRELPQVPDVVYKGKPLFVFNIGPDSYAQAMGSMGEFIIPACKEGEEVSEPLVIPQTVPEYYDNGTNKAGLELHNGIDVARAIVGISSGDAGLSTFTTNHEWHGAFISEHNPPTDKEIEKAKDKRRQWNEFNVNAADTHVMQGKLAEVNVPHRKSALELNVKRDWSKKTVSQANCPACGGDIPANVAVCLHCHAVIDEQMARKYFPERYKTEAKLEPVPAPRKGQ